MFQKFPLPRQIRRHLIRVAAIQGMQLRVSLWENAALVQLETLIYRTGRISPFLLSIFASLDIMRHRKMASVEPYQWSASTKTKS